MIQLLFVRSLFSDLAAQVAATKDTSSEKAVERQSGNGLSITQEKISLYRRYLDCPYKFEVKKNSLVAAAK